MVSFSLSKFELRSYEGLQIQYSGYYCEQRAGTLG
jgi:hypothetical protein